MDTIVLSLKQRILQHVEYTLATLPQHITSDWEAYLALAFAVRDRMIHGWTRTQSRHAEQDAKRVYYMSLEYLMGRTLGNSLINMGLDDECRQVLGDLGYRLEDLREAEWDAGLGNGGLGRLAACLLDSLATLDYPAYGYGLRYEYGIFHQRIVDGAQVEVPDAWLRYGNGSLQSGRPGPVRADRSLPARGGDRYLLLADYGSYAACQDRVAASYRDEESWTRKSILNTASMGKFSTDRTIRQYAEEIWGIVPSRP